MLHNPGGDWNPGLGGRPKVNPGSQQPFSKWWFLLDDGKPLLKYWWFVNQPIKNGGLTSRVNLYKDGATPPTSDTIYPGSQLLTRL